MSLEGDHDLSRSIIYHKAFLNSIHINEHLFIFETTKEDGASHESAIARSIAREDDEVHRIGCKIAKGQNERALKSCKDGILPQNKRRYYCGFRTAKICDLILEGEKYRIEIAIDGKTDEAAHVDVALFVDSSNKNEKYTIKTDAGLALAEAFGPATEFICEVDENDENHPLKKNANCLKEGLPRFDGA